ncbi:hypothetical protein [Solibacillus cecembensis]|uniref:hypothetical protein n=1 Tax=Solibacillus cecembensis TaxID=459347 RepID=UPI003D004769
MSEEKRLQQLKEIQVDTAKKEHDFQQIAARTNRKKFHWQVPAAVIGVLCIIVFLVASMPKQQMITSEADEEPQLVAIYALYGKGNPSSKWKMGVDEFTGQNNIMRMEEYLSELTLAEESLPNYVAIRNTYRLNYHDGSSRVFVEYDSTSSSYFYDKTNDILYSVGEDAKTPGLWSSEKNHVKDIVFPIFLVGYMVSSWFIGRKMRDPNDEKRRIPRHSTVKQSIATIVLVFVACLIIFIVPNIHFFYVVCMASLLAVINIILETLHGNNIWRKMDFIVSSVWVMGIFYFILL